MKKLDRNAMSELPLSFSKFYPKGINVCWKCFEEAMLKGISISQLNRFMLYEDAEFVKKHTKKKMIRVPSCLGGFEMRYIDFIDHHGLKRLEKIFLAKQVLWDFTYKGKGK